jgi:predicted PilT family ATPase
MAHRYLFDTMVLTCWEDLPPRWARPRSEVLAGRAEIVVFESLVAEAAHQLSSLPEGEQHARRLLGQILAVPRVLDDTRPAVEAIEAGVALNKIASQKGFKDARLSLVDFLSSWHAKRTRARLVTSDHGVRWCGRQLGVEVDYLPLGEWA